MDYVRLFWGLWTRWTNSDYVWFLRLLSDSTKTEEYNRNIDYRYRYIIYAGSTQFMGDSAKSMCHIDLGSCVWSGFNEFSEIWWYSVSWVSSFVLIILSCKCNDCSVLILTQKQGSKVVVIIVIFDFEWVCSAMSCELVLNTLQGDFITLEVLMDSTVGELKAMLLDYKTEDPIERQIITVELLQDCSIASTSAPPSWHLRALAEKARRQMTLKRKKRNTLPGLPKPSIGWLRWYTFGVSAQLVVAIQAIS